MMICPRFNVLCFRDSKMLPCLSQGYSKQKFDPKDANVKKRQHHLLKMIVSEMSLSMTQRQKFFDLLAGDMKRV